jgi:WD40 repeat protein
VIREAHLESQNGLAISSDGKLLATCDESREIKVWDLVTLRRRAVMKGHQGMITALQFSPDSRTLLSSSFDGTVKAWSVATGQHLMDVHIGAGGVNDMALSNNGSRIAIIEDRKRIRVIPLANEDSRQSSLDIARDAARHRDLPPPGSRRQPGQL